MKKNECPLCRGRLKKENVPYAFAGIHLGRFGAEVCEKCDEIFFTEEAWKRIERTAKSKGLWGIGRRVKIGHSGHSLIIRIPSKLAATAHLERGDTVFLQPAGDGRLLIEREHEE